jgi:hypothetical protein
MLSDARGLFVTADDAALVLAIRPDTLRAFDGDGRPPLPSVRFVRSVCWRVADLRAAVGLPALVEVAS